MRLDFLRQVGGRPSWRELGLYGLNGAVMALGQAPLFAWYLAFPALILGLFRLSLTKSVTEAAWAGWFLGAGYFACYLNWIVSPFFVDPVTYGWMAPFAVVLMAFGLALFWALASGLSRLFARKTPALVALLIGAELLRGVIFTGFPWAQPGHMWQYTGVDQLASVVGATGLTAITIALAALAARGRMAGICVALFALSASSYWGITREAAPDPAPRQASVRLVQPNAEQHLKWEPSLAREIFDRQLAMTARGAPADLTIWPETAVPYLLEYSPEIAPIITDASGGKPVALGIQRIEEGPGEDDIRAWNSLRILSGGGEIIDTYDKFHLVPFGEYIPMGDLLHEWLGIGAFAARTGSGYSAGTGPKVLDLGPALGKALPLICYEAVFPSIPRHAPERADWIMQITNDAWFGTLTGPFQHFELSRLRAIEMGLPVLRVGNTGVTAVIDARGKIVAKLPFAATDALDIAAIPGALPATPYARYGDLFALIVFIMSLALACINRRKASA